MTEVITSQEDVRQRIEQVETQLLEQAGRMGGDLGRKEQQGLVAAVSRRIGAPRSLVARTLRDLATMQAIGLKHA